MNNTASIVMSLYNNSYNNGIELFFDNNKIGWIEYCKKDSNRIGGLFVNEMHRNNGHGSLLLREYEKIAKSLGHDNIQVTSSQSAINFYRKNGFISISEFNKQYRSGLNWFICKTKILYGTNMIKNI